MNRRLFVSALICCAILAMTRAASAAAPSAFSGLQARLNAALAKAGANGAKMQIAAEKLIVVANEDANKAAQRAYNKARRLLRAAARRAGLKSVADHRVALATHLDAQRAAADKLSAALRYALEVERKMSLEDQEAIEELEENTRSLAIGQIGKPTAGTLAAETKKLHDAYLAKAKDRAAARKTQKEKIAKLMADLKTAVVYKPMATPPPRPEDVKTYREAIQKAVREAIEGVRKQLVAGLRPVLASAPDAAKVVAAYAKSEPVVLPAWAK